MSSFGNAEKTAATEVEFADLAKLAKELDTLEAKGVALEKQVDDKIAELKEKIKEEKAKIKEMIVAEMDGPAVVDKEYDFLAELEEMLNEEPVKEGVWSVLPARIPEFISKVEELKDEYHAVVGSDDVFDGLDRAISAAEELMMNTAEIKEAEGKIIKSYYDNGNWCCIIQK